ncbi:carbonic anhydrase [Niallia sp. MER 6]|uniref:carbonic anhydrase n=1 Tax=Niallia sp. MER 6 TaxID=2939567 RepID=UPI00203EA7A6|nr:carbonic anhydrase family protein [Niallia sp. MER 6]MCM3032111.1 carbonic anhydrase family protein [Niallia sp. MER 6]
MKKILVYPLLAVVSVFGMGACSTETGAGLKAEKEREIDAAHWSYEGDTSPVHWGELGQANLACVDGTEQSPINIDFSQVEAETSEGETEIKYKSSFFTLQNNGHTIQANAVDKSNTAVINGKEYNLAQFHFHTPSEHQFNGKNYEMELHLVHKDEDGKIAVIGVMIQEGDENKTLADLWNQLPQEETETDISLTKPVDLQALLPKEDIAFHYEGSLTTPPCTEQVNWTVFETPIEMSKEQIETFRRIFPDDHRPVQSLNERIIIKS